MLVDWTHARFAPLTVDVIHLLFTSAGDIADHITEYMSDYYEFLKVIIILCSYHHITSPQGYLATHQLDRNRLGLDLETFWSVVGKVMRAEFVEEAVLTPLTILCQDIASCNMDLAREDIVDLFDSDLVEEDVIPVLEMAM